MNINDLAKLSKEELQQKCREYDIEIDERWEKGIKHHPKAREIYNLLEMADWNFGYDHFCWKSGGDGDNGEALMYSLSILLELIDREAENVQI